MHSICIINAQSFVGEYLVSFFLKDQIRVVALLKDNIKKEDTTFLYYLASENPLLLSINYYNPLNRSTIIPVLKDVSTVFYTHNFHSFYSKIVNESIFHICLKKVSVIIKACNSAKIKRIIWLSSVNTIADMNTSIYISTEEHNQLYDENSVNKRAESDTINPDYIQIIIERKVIEDCTKYNIPFVIINSGHPLGPLLWPKLKKCSFLIIEILEGTLDVDVEASKCFVDIYDLVFALVTAMHNDDVVNQRVIVAESFLTSMQEIAMSLAVYFPDLPIYRGLITRGCRTPFLDNSKANSKLGINFHNTLISVKLMAVSIIQMGMYLNFAKEDTNYNLESPILNSQWDKFHLYLSQRDFSYSRIKK